MYMTVRNFLCLFSSQPQGEESGQVSTKFRIVGPNDRIIIGAFDDPAVPGK
ncbi:MAG: CreA family protein [Candidatus Thiodiazotropha sp.]